MIFSFRLLCSTINTKPSTFRSRRHVIHRVAPIADLIGQAVDACANAIHRPRRQAVAGLPPYAFQDATCMSIKAQWERLGGGMARVREFDSREQGLDYKDA